MQNIRKYAAFVFLGTLYLVCSIRITPGTVRESLWDTLVQVETLGETLYHMVSMGLFYLGATLISVVVYQKVTGTRMAWSRVVRVYLFIAICMEFLILLGGPSLMKGLAG